MNYNWQDNMINSNINKGFSNNIKPYYNNSDRFGFIGPFILGGITGGLLAPAFNQRPYYNNYYYPYPYYGPYYPYYR